MGADARRTAVALALLTDRATEQCAKAELDQHLGEDQPSLGLEHRFESVYL